MSCMARQKFTHQSHGLQARIFVRVKYKQTKSANTTMKTREEVEAAVKAHMPSQVLSDILTFVRNGYDALYKEVGSWLKSCPKTLCHNTQVLCLTFAAWGKTTIHLGLLEEWWCVASPLWLKGPLKDICLWINLFDLALKGKKTTSQKGPDWSHKKNGPGHHYMAKMPTAGSVPFGVSTHPRSGMGNGYASTEPGLSPLWRVPL